MRSSGFAIALVIAMLLAATSVAHAAPSPEAPVDDQAGILSEADKDKLVAELNGLRRDGVQMAVIVVGSTQGVSIQQFTRTAAEAWSSGPTPAALLVVATGDRKMRLEVNESLRPKFPDTRAQSILDNQRSAFRAADYAGGIRSIILDVRSVALGAETPTGETAPPSSSSSSSSGTSPAPSRSSGGSNAATIVAVIVGIGVLLGIGALVAAAKRSRSLSLSGTGALNATPFWIDMLLGTLQVIGFLFVIIAIFASATSSSSSSSSSLFGGGSSSGGSSGGGGGGGGGWSGGGASSSW